MYGYTLDYCLYRLTFAQALSLIDTHTERERRIHEATQKQQNEDSGYVDPSTVSTAPEDLPTIEDLRAVFGAMLG